MSFELHAQLAKDTIVIGDLPLCRLLLMNDAQYPWCILVPRVEGVREAYELGHEAQEQLTRESAIVGKTLMALFDGHKLNVAALGNMVPQLHLHHIVRFPTDPAWPKPVWGVSPAQPYSEQDAQALKQKIHGALSPLIAITG
ncbi:HIT domain-containing protein [Hahella sp. HN01]|uniref:HIT domain-containing protein n=1 Tax=Hahella sp. HN01 TaxID=2847262 RepID=UPI001C1EBFEF|nr:HIT domain-containing protein [Hahella sp. HN01]